MTPAPGFRILDREERPYLPSQALHAVRWYHDEVGIRVSMQATTVLLALCDLVDASHGQFYGSWDNLISRYPWTRSLWFKHLTELESLHLVENLGRINNRKTTTWQVLPDVYRLVSTREDTSEEGE